MEIRHLRYFCVLAEQLHFTRAAVLLNVAQPALSHQIKQLEEELGTQLVERSNRRVRLTAAGEVFRERAVRILEQLDQAARETVRAGQGETGSLIIGVVSTAVCSVLPELLRRFRRDAPEISIDIREMEPAEQVEALRRETIDIGLLFLAIQDVAFDSLVVSRERLIVALPTGHPAAAAGKGASQRSGRGNVSHPATAARPGFSRSGSRSASLARDPGATLAAHAIAANRGLLSGRTLGRCAGAGVLPESSAGSRLRIPRYRRRACPRRSDRIVAQRQRAAGGAKIRPAAQANAESLRRK